MAHENSGILYNALTSGSKIIGSIIADNDIRLDGQLEGELKCSGKVVIGQSGYIKGKIECQNAEINGAVDGTIIVSETLILHKTSKITGEINIRTLIIEPGATFNGSCEMGKKSASH